MRGHRLSARVWGAVQGDARSDAFATGTAAFTYGLTLGAAILTLPLLALGSGYSPAQVGLLAAVSGAMQVATRLTLGTVMRRWPDRFLVTAAALLLALAFLGMAVSTSLSTFVVAHLLIGVSRACFWTGLQAHVVRDDAYIIKGLARVNLLANSGLLAGPLAAGLLLGQSSTLLLILLVAAGALTAGLSLGMRRLPLFQPPDRTSRSSLLRRPEVLAGCVAACVAGTWRGLVGSYVPIVLSTAGQSAGTIGVLIALGNAANTLSAAPLARVVTKASARSFTLPTLATGLCCGLIGVASGNSVLAGLLLLLGGAGAGILQILGSGLAAAAVDRQERGNAIAVTGTARALAMLGAPLSIAGLVQLMTVSAALAGIGAILTVPVAIQGLRRAVRSPAA